MKTVTYSTTARRKLNKLPADVQAAIKVAVRRFAETGQGDIKKVQGADKTWRVRAGTYRALFRMEGEAIIVDDVDHRSRIYR